MSTSALRCPRCAKQLAVKLKSGRVRPEGGVKHALVPGGIKLTCTCGAHRIETILAKAA